jgi:hypothetical protein
MADDWTTRETILTLGAPYVVQHDAPAFPEAGFEAGFEAGERVLLRHVGYSRYDGAYVYEFEVDGGARKSFWLFDRDPSSKLAETFARDAAA